MCQYFEELSFEVGPSFIGLRLSVSSLKPSSLIEVENECAYSIKEWPTLKLSSWSEYWCMSRSKLFNLGLLNSISTKPAFSNGDWQNWLTTVRFNSDRESLTKLPSWIGNWWWTMLPNQAASCKSALPDSYISFYTWLIKSGPLSDQGQTLVHFEDHFRWTLHLAYNWSPLDERVTSATKS